MDEAFGMSTNEQTGWKKRKIPNLAISNEASTASSTPVASTRQACGSSGSRCSGPTTNHSFGRCGHHDGLGHSDDKAKDGSTAVWCKFCGNSSRQQLETKISRGLRRLVCETTRKRRGIGTPVGMLKTRSSLWVCHIITQQSSHSRHALCCAQHRIALWIDKSWIRGNGQMQTCSLGQCTWVLHTNPSQIQGGQAMDLGGHNSFRRTSSIYGTISGHDLTTYRWSDYDCS